jgi:hypothetical protein
MANNDDSNRDRSSFFGGRATRLEMYAIAIVILILGFGSVGGAIVVTSNSGSDSTSSAPPPAETVATSPESTTTAPPDTTPSTEQPATTDTTSQQRTITTDVRGAELPVPVPADRCASTVTIPNVIGMELWQVSARWPTGFPECGPIMHRLFGYTLDGQKVIGGYDCPDGTPLRVESQDPQLGASFTVAQLVSQGTSVTWGPCPGVVPR